MEKLKTHTVVIGAGVIGLSIAREISSLGHEVILLEKKNICGEGISSRNSGVIHSGLYYNKDSNKAKLCLEGNNLLYQYANEKDIPYNKCGKIIIASTDEEKKIIDRLYANGLANGVEGLEILTQSEVYNIQPDIRAKAGLLSKTTGIIDVPELIKRLEVDLQSNRGILSLNSNVDEISINNKQRFNINVKSNENFCIESDYLINAAGLDAIKVAKNISTLPLQHIPRQYYAKGHYFKISGPHPFNGPLIYPINNKDGLGIHLTFNIDNTIKFGPDVSWTNKIDYSFDEKIKDKFILAIKKYWPELNSDKLMFDYVGIRPKIYGPKEKPADFLIQTYSDHGIKRLVNLFGIESPGLTSSLAIAKKVKNQLFDL